MVRRNVVIAIVAGALFGISCGGDEAPLPVKPSEPFVNPKPVVAICSPGEIAVGDSLKLLGQSFIDPAHGKVYLQFKGNFFDSQGGSNPVDLQVTPKVSTTEKGQVKSLSWEMWPNIVFHKGGDQLGRFVGQVIAVNAANDGSQQSSDPLAVAINILPSILPRLSQPVDAKCGAVVKDTLERQPMAFIGEVIGLRAGTSTAPLTFRWTFQAEQWTLGFKSTGVNGIWEFIQNNKLSPFFTLEPGDVVRPKTGGIVLEHTVTNGLTSKLGTMWDTPFTVRMASTAGKEPLGTARLAELITGSLANPGSSTATVNVEAEDASGKSAHLSLNLTIRQIAELIYNGDERVAENEAPKQMSGCIFGGTLGTDYSYTESESERRDRSVSYNWNTNYSVGMSASIGQWLPGFNWNVSFNAGLSYGFGVNVAESVSSDKSTSRSMSKHILPGQVGMVYRQTVKIHRVGQVVVNTACGQSINIGDAVLTDWTWAAEVATGATCVPKPASSFVAQKFEF